MQEDTQNDIELISLKNISLVMNEQNNFTHTIQSSSSALNQGSSKNLQSINTETQYLLSIGFQLTQTQPLTPLQRSSIDLFQLFVGIEYQIKSIIKLSNLFDLKGLIYFMEMEVILKKDNLVEKGYFKVNTIEQETYLRHCMQIYFTQNKRYLIDQNSLLTLILGNKENQWPFTISNFRAIMKKNTEPIQFQSSQQKPIIKSLSYPNDFSYPLISKLELLSSINMQNEISSLAFYQSPCPSQQSTRQLYICHDMKGGYIEDINSFTPYLQKNKSHSYRFNYLNQTKIFNYFSHYPITIPPKMWRNLCKKYNVLCLGTFIVQNNGLKMNEEDFLTEDFALKLIYIAKKARFDGYLINIEIPIKRTDLLIKWLQFLTSNINKLIPNSQIVWYDSVIPSGQIQYQNELNLKNKPFYQACNGIFTNYWWTENSLKTSLVHKHPSKDIYIGNDCFGRNTYGGGKYEIVKAVHKITELGQSKLSVALFAPGFTYENNGQTVRENLLQNQIKMYHGHQIQSRNIDKWKYTQQGGQGWKQEGQWAVTSFQVCKRQALIKISDYKGKKACLNLYFSCYVTGTGPNFADYYKISMQLIDYKNGTVYLDHCHPKMVTSQKQELVEIRMQIDCLTITQTICIRVSEQGKDSEFWGGHYGSRFKGQKIAIITQSKERNWIQTISIRPIQLQNKYSTFFNKGQGDHFYLFGQKMQKKYSCLADYDLAPVFSMNDSSKISLSYEDAYIGGTCLKFQNTFKIHLNKFSLKFSENETSKRIRVILIVKSCLPLQITCGDFKGQFIQSKRQQNNNGWKTYSALLQFPYNTIQFLAEISLKTNNGLIGRFSLIQQRQKQLIVEHGVETQVKIELSKESKAILPFSFDLIVSAHYIKSNSKIPQRLLIIIGQFSSFMGLTSKMIQTDEIKEQESKKLNISELKGILRNIPAIHKKVEQFDLTIMNIESISPKILFEQKISKTLLNNLIRNKFLTFNMLL